MLTHGRLSMANLVTKCSMQPVLTILRMYLVLWLMLMWMPFSHGGTSLSSANDPPCLSLTHQYIRKVFGREGGAPQPVQERHGNTSVSTLAAQRKARESL